ncbi:Putative polysaccharide biosynthesis protein [Desulfonema limicola]|uniref:Polysaccharide biosynthesis protein n=1 Tax=Desulfonema limicola TaxID=45656 RepID=A0A975GIF7_9BACT|nr:oligosaccharide flippase family protein [Desulfonema limicola]QTA81898.1 Putative polysaccharide biosynthesis protein [Desulfonema limicola]
MKFSLNKILKYVSSLPGSPEISHTQLSEIEQKIAQFGAYFTGIIISKIFSVITNIYIGRTLGPNIFGQITMVLLLAGFLNIPMTGGWGVAFVRLGAAEDNEKKQFDILKSVLFISVFFTILFTLLLWISAPVLRELFAVDKTMMTLTILITVTSAWYSLSKLISQGFQDWRNYVFIENAWAFIILGLVIVFFLCSMKTYYHVIWIFAFAYTASSFFSFYYFYNAVRQGCIKKDTVSDVLKRGTLLMSTGLLSMTAFSLDRIIINRFLDSTEVGIYQAHFFATYGVISTLTSIFFNYVFPLLCRSDSEKKDKLINLVFKVSYPFLIIISVSAGGLIMFMFNYRFSPWLFITLSLFNAVQFHVQLKAWILASKSIYSTRLVLGGQIVFFIVNIIVLTAFISSLGILAGGIALLAAALGSLLYFFIKTKRIN